VNGEDSTHPFSRKTSSNFVGHVGNQVVRAREGQGLSSEKRNKKRTHARVPIIGGCTKGALMTTWM